MAIDLDAMLAKVAAERALIDKGWSQAGFCRRVGVSPKHLNQVILGHTVATSAQLDYWAFVLGMRWSVRLVKRGRVAADATEVSQHG